MDNECFKKLDLIDLALFDFIYHFFNCDIEDKVTFKYKGKEYVEIRHQLIEKEMPILNFGCRKTFITRMSKLVDAGLICRYENNSKENRSGYCRGKNFSKLVFIETNRDNKERVTEELQVCNLEVSDGVTKELHNHSNKDNIDNKEEKDKSFSKKDATKEIIQFWNTQTSDFSKVRKQTADIEDKLAKLIKKGYSLEDVKKVILLCNSLPDFYKGREKGKTWKASLSWLLANTKDKFNMIYNGDLHTTFEQQKIYESIMNGNTDDMKMEYRPQLDGFNLHWNENTKCYISMYDIDMLFDGYTAENRPSSAMVMKGGIRYKWNTQTKKWEVQ